MNISLIQLRDCEGEAIGLYAYSEERYTFSEATALLDSKYADGKEQLLEANGDDEDEQSFGVGDVQEYMDELLAEVGITRVYAEDHQSSEF